MIKAPDVTFLYVVLAFIVSYAVMKKYLFTPLGRILEQRENEEREANRLRSESVRRLEEAIAQGEARLAAARREALKEREALRSQGLAVFERELALAREQATSSVDTATTSIDEDARRASVDLTNRARSLAVALAEKILGRKLAA